MNPPLFYNLLGNQSSSIPNPKAFVKYKLKLSLFTAFRWFSNWLYGGVITSWLYKWTGLTVVYTEERFNIRRNFWVGFVLVLRFFFWGLLVFLFIGLIKSWWGWDSWVYFIIFVGCVCLKVGFMLKYIQNKLSMS